MQLRSTDWWEKGKKPTRYSNNAMDVACIDILRRWAKVFHKGHNKVREFRKDRNHKNTSKESSTSKENVGHYLKLDKNSDDGAGEPESWDDENMEDRNLKTNMKKKLS